MLLPLQKIIFTLTFNVCLFLILIVGIQNSSNKGKIDLYINETIDLPISFIIGTSFISGSFLGSIFFMSFNHKKIK